jgi:nucleotide-binding universal stress UspA family protein
MIQRKRTYLVVIDNSVAARPALRFAAYHAANSFSGMEVLALVEPQEFMQWGGVQAAMETEERQRIEGEVAACLSELPGGTSFCLGPIVIRKGEPAEIVRAHLAERTDIAALVVGAAPTGDPGPLVTTLAGTDSGTWPCPVLIVPGSLSDTRIEELS